MVVENFVDTGLDRTPQAMAEEVYDYDSSAGKSTSPPRRQELWVCLILQILR